MGVESDVVEKLSRLDAEFDAGEERTSVGAIASVSTSVSRPAWSVPSGASPVLRTSVATPSDVGSGMVSGRVSPEAGKGLVASSVVSSTAFLPASSGDVADEVLLMGVSLRECRGMPGNEVWVSRTDAGAEPISPRRREAARREPAAQWVSGMVPVRLFLRGPCSARRRPARPGPSAHRRRRRCALWR